MEILIVVLLCIAIVLLIVLMLRRPAVGGSRQIEERLIRLESEVEKLSPRIESEFRENRREISENFGQIQKTVDTRVKSLQDDNSARLEQMRQTVDEKLQESVEKRFNESFRRISSQLTQVYQGLGEMKNLANGVGDLKKVMEGVKTRGIYGEVQLGNIISDSMTKDQYVENFATRKGSAERVEFAIKMPGQCDEIVYLPIDSKFPVENYSRLVAAYDHGDKTEIAGFRKELAKDVKTQAKKISKNILTHQPRLILGSCLYRQKVYTRKFCVSRGYLMKCVKKCASRFARPRLCQLFYPVLQWGFVRWRSSSVAPKFGVHLAQLRRNLVNSAICSQRPRKT